MIEVVMERFAALLRAPTAAELAQAWAVDEAEASRRLRSLHEQHLLVLDDAGAIRMAAPFSAVPTDYVATVNGRRHFGNCIWDALGIVALLGGVGRVEKGSELRVECAIRRVSAPREYVVHFLVPAARWWEDIGSGDIAEAKRACERSWQAKPISCLFRSEEELDVWLAGRERGATMTVDTCWRLARAWYSDKGRPGYRSKTLEEAQATFASLGLTGDFWALA